jgi:GxxExxY protein
MKGYEPGGALTEQIIGLAIKVHRTVGPGLLESVYNRCLCWELDHAGLEFQREVPLSIVYWDERLPAGYLADVIVERTVLLELKSVERLLPIHEAQTLTYLRLSGCQIALLMNFNSVLLKDGLRRFVP